jgi:hypothetical protein
MRTVPNARQIALLSWILSALGLAFYWWNPMGIVLSLCALLAGFIGCVSARRQGSMTLALVGLFVALAVLALDCWVAASGLATLQFTALR